MGVTVWDRYVRWAQRRSEPVQMLVFFATLFLFLGVVAPVLDLADWIRSRFQRKGEAGRDE